MPKNNNLQDYLKDLYEGIVSRKPDASKNPQDFRREIENLALTDDADAIAADIRLGKTAYVDNEKITGTIEDYDGAVIFNGKSQVIDPNTPFLFRIEELNNDSSTPANIDLELFGLSFKPVKNNHSIEGEPIRNYVYRFYFYAPTSCRVKVSVLRNNGNTTDSCIWAAGELDTIIPITTSSEYIDEWPSSETMYFVNATGHKPNSVISLYTYDVESGAHFVEIKLADVNNSAAARSASINLSFF